MNTNTNVSNRNPRNNVRRKRNPKNQQKALAPRQPSRRRSRPNNNRQTRPSNNRGMIAAPVAITTVQTGRAPRIDQSNSRSCRIRHRELIASVLTNTDFQVLLGLSINPGLNATFPWLSIQAQGWESYRFNKLTFSYCTRASTSTQGSIAMAVDYDAGDQLPITEEIMSTYQSCRETSVWNNLNVTADPRAMYTTGKSKYVRSDAVFSRGDPRLYDSGVFILAMSDGPSTNVGAGKVWVDYDITFYDPQTNATAIPHYGVILGGGDPIATKIWGSAPQAQGDITLYASPNSNTVYLNNLSPGTYVSLKTVLYGTTISAVTLANTVGIDNTLSLNVANSIGAGGVEAIRCDWFYVTNPSVRVTLGVTAATIDNNCVCEAAVVPKTMNGFIAAYINPVDVLEEDATVDLQRFSPISPMVVDEVPDEAPPNLPVATSSQALAAQTWMARQTVLVNPNHPQGMKQNYTK